MDVGMSSIQYITRRNCKSNNTGEQGACTTRGTRPITVHLPKHPYVDQWLHCISNNQAVFLLYFPWLQCNSLYLLYNSLYFSYSVAHASAPCMLSDICCLLAFMAAAVHACICCLLSCNCCSMVVCFFPRHRTFGASFTKIITMRSIIVIIICMCSVLFRNLRF